MTPTLVLTRPEAQSREIADAVGRAAKVIISPIIEIVAAGPAPEIGGYGGVVLTSANALDFAPPLDGVPAYCVGPRTAEAARNAGADVRLVAENADDLVARCDGAGPLIHLRGEHARGEVAKRLTSAGIETNEAVIYHQRACALSGAARAAITGTAPVVLPLYSPRSARLVAGDVDAIGARVRVLALSPAVADAWRAATGQDPDIAVHPTGESLLNLVKSALRG